MSWSIQEAKDLYNIEHWGAGYFDISEQGDLLAYPNGQDSKHAINLAELCEKINNADLHYPVLIRFTDILKQQFNQLRNSFQQAIDEFHYRGNYTGVYPIKVNQQYRVVTDLLKHGGKNIGLEAGSKAELMAILALSTHPDSLIICNGYKDKELIRLALIAQRLGHRVCIVLEKMSELDLVFEEAEKVGVTPCLGLRIRLANQASGKWQQTSGEKSKFGLSATQVLQVIDKMKEKNVLHTLQLLHCHMGSQIANINDIQSAMHECARYYAELFALGVPISMIDVGGGLGVDYEGTHTRSSCSMNYSMQEYANTIVYTLSDICNQNDIPHPDIITESGRALTAHHALLITNIIGAETPEQSLEKLTPCDDDKLILENLWYNLENLTARTAQEAYHDACYWIKEVYGMYTHGLISLKERARAEQIYTAICLEARTLLKPNIRSHREIIDELNEKLADKYYCNLSLFQSLPDAWAIQQIFPILPLSNLNKQPTRRGILQDITCDSDGVIDLYIDGQGIESTLPLLPFDPNKTNLLGIFLVGAYQESLGDMHNLFGDTDSVNVEMREDGSYELIHPTKGDTVETVLHYVQYDTEKLLAAYRNKLISSTLNEEEKNTVFNELESSLRGYTYLEEE